MSELDIVKREGLEVSDEPRQVWVRVKDAVGLIFEGNPKLHNLGELMESIKKYGFQEVANLLKGLGIVNLKEF